MAAMTQSVSDGAIIAQAGATGGKENAERHNDEGTRLRLKLRFGACRVQAFEECRPLPPLVLCLSADCYPVNNW